VRVHDLRPFCPQDPDQPTSLASAAASPKSGSRRIGAISVGFTPSSSAK
jgi:hypothetical protein